jgi:hypothetical protein
MIPEKTRRRRRPKIQQLHTGAEVTAATEAAASSDEEI